MAELGRQYQSVANAAAGSSANQTARPARSPVLRTTRGNACPGLNAP